MNVFDWCSWGRHDECRSPLCACDCGCQNPMVERDSRRFTVESEAQSGPESAATDRGLATVSTTAKGA